LHRVSESHSLISSIFWLYRSAKVLSILGICLNSAVVSLMIRRIDCIVCGCSAKTSSLTAITKLTQGVGQSPNRLKMPLSTIGFVMNRRSEEHTSELQSRE